MTIEEYATLISTSPIDPTVKVADLTGGDRTLLYGYDTDRDSWHVYLQDGKIHRFIYRLSGHMQDNRPTFHNLMHSARESWTVEDLIPNKRAYPERTDYEFARILKERGGEISFTTYDEDVEPKQYYGALAAY